MKRPGQFVIWPSNIDSSNSRSQGRKLPISRSVKQPTLKEMFQAATVLGYTPISTEKASSPQDSWRREGYLVVKKTSSRQIVLKNIANEILKGRQKDLQTIQDKKK